MSEPHLEPLDRELLDFIAYERDEPGIPVEVMSRLRGRLATAIPGMAPPPPPPSSPAPSAPAPSAPHGLSLLHHPIRFGLATFAIGGLVGAGVHAGLAPSAPIAAPPIAQTAPAPVVAPVPPPAPPPPIPAPVAPPPAPIVQPPAVVHHAPRPPSPLPHDDAPAGRDTALAAETALVEIARSALARRDVPGCIDALQRHLAQFPNGQLVEERESLWVQALVNDGQLAAAKDRANKFRQRFPHSLLLPAIDAAVPSIP